MRQPPPEIRCPISPSSEKALCSVLSLLLIHGYVILFNSSFWTHSKIFVHIWDVSTEAGVSILSEHTGSVNGEAYSPDRRFLASGSRDRMVRIGDQERFDLLGE